MSFQCFGIIFRTFSIRSYSKYVSQDPKRILERISWSDLSNYFSYYLAWSHVIAKNLWCLDPSKGTQKNSNPDIQDQRILNCSLTTTTKNGNHDGILKLWPMLIQEFRNKLDDPQRVARILIITAKISTESSRIGVLMQILMSLTPAPLVIVNILAKNPRRSLNT